jgi:hypothetical protein
LGNLQIIGDHLHRKSTANPASTRSVAGQANVLGQDQLLDELARLTGERLPAA